MGLSRMSRWDSLTREFGGVVTSDDIGTYSWRQDIDEFILDIFFAVIRVIRPAVNERNYSFAFGLSFANIASATFRRCTLPVAVLGISF